jgi:hypothetical protein
MYRGKIVNSVQFEILKKSLESIASKLNCNVLVWINSAVLTDQIREAFKTNETLLLFRTWGVLTIYEAGPSQRLGFDHTGPPVFLGAKAPLGIVTVTN